MEPPATRLVFLSFFCVLLACAASTGLLLSGTAAAQAVLSYGRTVKFQAADGQPSYLLRVSVAGALGSIDVLELSDDRTGAVVQALGCQLLRDSPSPSEGELDDARHRFVANIKVEDINLDGYADVMALREYGAKWGKYCVWLYDPQSHKFVKGALADELESLSNIGANAEKGWLTSAHADPENPSRTVYRIAGQDAGVAGSGRLVKIQTCSIELDAAPETPWIAVVSSYAGARAAVDRLPLREKDLRAAFSYCDALVKP
jgi:hypothetical protein